MTHRVKRSFIINEGDAYLLTLFECVVDKRAENENIIPAAAFGSKAGLSICEKAFRLRGDPCQQALREYFVDMVQ